MTEEYLDSDHVDALKNWGVDTEAIQGVIALVKEGLLHPREARVTLGLSEQPIWHTPKITFEDVSATDDTPNQEVYWLVDKTTGQPIRRLNVNDYDPNQFRVVAFGSDGMTQLSEINRERKCDD